MSEAGRYVPHLPLHWTGRSVYGAIDAVARFNLVSPRELATIAEGCIQDSFNLSTTIPSLVGELISFKYWLAVRRRGALKAIEHAHEASFLGSIVKASLQNITHVELAWFADQVRWCPLCARSGVHLLMHQHRALLHCPVHHVRLENHCHYCGKDRRYSRVTMVGLLVCHFCGAPAEEQQDFVEAPDASTVDYARVTERIQIPGLPTAGDSHTPRGLSPQHLRQFFAGWLHPEYERPAQSELLSVYFRNDRQPLLATPGRGHAEAVEATTAKARELARRHGHTCLEALGQRSRPQPHMCPCAAGFTLWRQRVFREAYESWAKLGGTDASTYEASHLGLCLSACCFASAQARHHADPHVFLLLIEFLDPAAYKKWAVTPSSTLERGMIVTLASDFQWGMCSCSSLEEGFKIKQRQWAQVARGGRPEQISSFQETLDWLMHPIAE